MFFDVETTGLHSDDRIVSLGMCLLFEPDPGRFSVERLHLVFDPCRRSHTQAEAVHGYDDWTLRHQPMFFEHAAEIWALVSKADVLVAHNRDFDIQFLRTEMAACGFDVSVKLTFCTMEMVRATGRPSSLKACVAALGIRRRSTAHDAAEDAWLCMMVYVRHFCPRMRIEALAPLPLANRLPVPPRPPGELPRRHNVRRIAERRAMHPVDQTATIAGQDPEGKTIDGAPGCAIGIDEGLGRGKPHRRSCAE